MTTFLCVDPDGIEIGTYTNPVTSNGYVGYVAADKWILYEKDNGALVLFLRDQRNDGAIIGKGVKLSPVGSR